MKIIIEYQEDPEMFISEFTNRLDRKIPESCTRKSVDKYRQHLSIPK